MDLSALDGRAYAKFLAAGAYFLRKYRHVVNELNVFPVPDGDAGTNMYLTARSACLEAGRSRTASLGEVAALAAQASLTGARGNSGAILSQMFRGFANGVRDDRETGPVVVASAMREAVSAAKRALVNPVDGTIISVAEAAAEAARRAAAHERDCYRLLDGAVLAANNALDRTPEQLDVLKEAGVVDAGGAGFTYFLEGALRFQPGVNVRETAFPREPVKQRVFTAAQSVGENKFCTELVLEEAACSVADLRRELEPCGESLLVIGAPPTIKVHVHAGDPTRVQRIAAGHGRVTRVKVDDMERQHDLLVAERPAARYSAVAVVPGVGFERIARELGAEITVPAEGAGVQELLSAVNGALYDDVYLFVNERDGLQAARELPGRTSKRVHVLPTPDVVHGIAGLFALRANMDEALPADDRVMRAVARVRAARALLAGDGAVAYFDGAAFSGETLAAAAVRALNAMGANGGGLVTLYYGERQTERDAERLAAAVRTAFPACEVEYYYGGMSTAQCWVSLDE